MAIMTKILLRPGALKALNAAYELLGEIVPMNFDCGRLCGKNCCRADDTAENGMTLYPYEEEILPPSSDVFPYRVVPSDAVRRDGKVLICEGKCTRENRPLACRIFPLRIAVKTDSDTNEPYAVAELDPRAKSICPLADGNVQGMNREFVRTVEAAGNRLLQNTVQMQALYEEQDALNRADFLGGSDTEK